MQVGATIYVYADINYVYVYVYLQLLSDWVHHFSTTAAMVLDQGRKVFVYSGKNDYVCNYIGGAEWTNATQWRNQVRQTNFTQ